MSIKLVKWADGTFSIRKKILFFKPLYYNPNGYKYDSILLKDDVWIDYRDTAFKRNCIYESYEDALCVYQKITGNGTIVKGDISE